MKKFRAKMRKVRMMRWSKLSLGEKILRVIISLLKIAVVIAIVVAIASAVFAVAVGLIVTSCIASALSGGFNYVGNNERFVRFR